MDFTGRDLKDLDEALDCAITLVAEKISECEQSPRPRDNRELSVRTDPGRYIAKVAFRYVCLD